jgi:hypothetical protein
MSSRILATGASVLALSLVAPRASAAQETVAVSPGEAVTRPPDDLPRLDERTAYMIGARRLKLGLLAFEYGITERISVGTDPPAWAVRAFASVLIPNLHAKVLLFERGPLAVALRGGVYYAYLGGGSNGGSSGNLLTAPLSLFPSVRLAPRVWLHGEATYVFARAFGTGNTDNADVNGAVAARAAQAGALFELRLTRIFSLLALGRYQFYSGPLVLGATAEPDPSTTVRVDAEMRARVEHPWQAAGGVAFLWPHVRLIVGAGYGYFFVPGLSVAVPERTIFPEASLYVVL